MKTIFRGGRSVLLSFILAAVCLAHSDTDDLAYVEPLNVPGMPVQVGAATLRKGSGSEAPARTLEYTLYNLSGEDVKDVAVNLYQFDEENKELGVVTLDAPGLIERNQSKSLAEAFESSALSDDGKAYITNVKKIDPHAVRFVLTVHSACVYEGRLYVSLADFGDAVDLYISNKPFSFPGVTKRKGQKGWACPF